MVLILLLKTPWPKSSQKNFKTNMNVTSHSTDFRQSRSVSNRVKKCCRVTVGISAIMADKCTRTTNRSSQRLIVGLLSPDPLPYWLLSPVTSKNLMTTHSRLFEQSYYQLDKPTNKLRQK